MELNVLLVLILSVLNINIESFQSYSFTTLRSITSWRLKRNICIKISNDDCLKYELVAKMACKLAGKQIVKGSGSINLSTDVESKIGSRDIVTQTDLISQNIIKSTITSFFPTHTFLGEEDILPGREAASQALSEVMTHENLWIIDPVDGTTNFAHGMSLCGIILAYVSKGEVLFGCIYDPFLDEMFSAWKGKGAYLNDNPIRCCETSQLKSSVVCTGSPPNIKSLEACLRATNLISSEVRTMRMLGSASIMLSWLACGRVTAYFEADMNAWDTAAGALLVKEAGGNVTDVWGKSFLLNTRNIVASNGIIHDSLLERLQKAKMWMKDE